MVLLKYLLFFYAVFGLLVSGGLLFNKENKANIFLAIFTLLFSFSQFDFLYNTTGLVYQFPEFKAFSLSFWLLFGPSLWFYVLFFTIRKKLVWKDAIHLIPFFIYFGLTIYFFTFSGKERLIYFWKNFNDIIMPINYGIAIHISTYAVFMVFFLKKHSKHWANEKKFYLSTIIVLYILTVLVESYLTVYAESYRWFIYYFLFTSTLVLFVAYIMYFKPETFKQLSKKYYSSGLTKKDMERIVKKINIFLNIEKNIIDSSLNLSKMCKSLDEKTHHVSQTISEELQTNFKDLINKKRVNLAKNILSNKDNLNMKLFAVALESGFSNKSTFHRVFVKFEGCTPNEYRKKSLI